MKNLEGKAILILTAGIAVFLGFGSLSLMTTLDQMRYTTKIHQSSEVLNAAQQSLRSEGRQAARESLKELQPLLEPEFRKEAVDKLLKNPTRKNLVFLVDAESRFQKFTYVTVSNLNNRAKTYGFISLILAGIIFFSVALWNRRKIYTPIHELNSRMLDFLNDRYSYEFETPENSELGKLQTTFNMMAQRVLDQIKELQGLDKAKSEFLSIASHELRTPLTSIKGSLSLLQGGVAGKMNAETANLLGIALDETDRLIRLINDLLDLAKIEAGGFDMQSDWVSLQELAEHASKALDGYAKTANVNISVEISEPVDVKIDKDRILQVIANLASNAIKFSPENSTVHLRAYPTEEGHLRFEVTDEGKGISPEDQAHIFEKFRQVTGPQNPLVKGTGLGLAIAKGLVEEHGGSIGVESKPGQGATFYFLLVDWRPSQISQVEAS